MNRFFHATAAAALLGGIGMAALAYAETVVPISGPGFKPGAPSWYIEGSAADPMGAFPARPPQGPRPPAPPPAADFSNAHNLGPGANGTGPDGMPPRCAHSPVCQDTGTRFGAVTDGVLRVGWKANTKWTYSYPFALPAGGGDVTGVGIDGQDNAWIWERNTPGMPALFKFDADHKLLFTVPGELTDQTMPFRGHGMCVNSRTGDAIVLNEYGQTARQFSKDGKLIRVIGVKGHRGDWDEAKGQRLLWEPVTCAFAPNDDIYIFEGHGDESPNDMGSTDLTNVIGVARVLHLDKDAKFVNQWYGNVRGPGKFNSAHGSAIDPTNGDIWVGDREDFRIAIYSANGHFIRSIQMRNLICALYFDNHPGKRFGTVWLATGMDGQVIRIDRNGNTLEVAGGNQKGGNPGQFNEATNMTSDSKGNLMVADTQMPRATWLSPAKK